MAMKHRDMKDLAWQKQKMKFCLAFHLDAGSEAVSQLNGEATHGESSP